MFNHNRFIPIYYDSIFKEILNFSNKFLLIYLLNYITGINIDILKDSIFIINPFNGIINVHNKSNTSDLKIIFFNNSASLEMNTYFNKKILIKNRYGAFKFYCSKNVKGQEYNLDDIVYLININLGNFHKFNNIPDDVFKLEGLIYIKDYDIDISYNYKEIYLILDKINKKYYDKFGKLKDNIDVRKLEIHEIILLLFSCSYYDDLHRLLEGRDELMELENKIKELNGNEYIYNDIFCRPLTFEEEKEAIYEEGIEQGKDQGISQGIKQEKRNMIKNMYQCGISLDLIAKSSRLPINQVKSIISSSNI